MRHVNDRLMLYGFIAGTIILAVLAFWFIGPMDNATAPWL